MKYNSIREYVEHTLKDKGYDHPAIDEPLYDQDQIVSLLYNYAVGIELASDYRICYVYDGEEPKCSIEAFITGCVEIYHPYLRVIDTGVEGDNELSYAIICGKVYRYSLRPGERIYSDDDMTDMYTVSIHNIKQVQATEVPNNVVAFIRIHEDYFEDV